jgi:hypothetical protein
MSIENPTFKLDDNGKKANIAIRKLVLQTSNLKQPLTYELILCAALENKGLC